jgi:hypothetical protein
MTQANGWVFLSSLIQYLKIELVSLLIFGWIGIDCNRITTDYFSQKNKEGLSAPHREHTIDEKGEPEVGKTLYR